MAKFIVTIDGPCGAGKTTTAKALAKKLHATYLDTGGLYRALAYAFIKKGFDPYSASAKARDTEASNILDFDIAIKYDNAGNMQFRLNCQDITDAIRTEEISDMSSKISVYPEIRDAISRKARKIAYDGNRIVRNVIAEGRDTGTVLFPEATCRFYLTASLMARGVRRIEQTPDQFKTAQDAIEMIGIRDERDMNREIAPLPSESRAEYKGLTIINNESMTLDETIDKMEQLINEAINAK